MLRLAHTNQELALAQRKACADRYIQAIEKARNCGLFIQTCIVLFEIAIFFMLLFVLFTCIQVVSVNSTHVLGATSLLLLEENLISSVGRR